ncbi:MAG: ATP-grasp domain-containing protein [Treponemataceae bacterium]
MRIVFYSTNSNNYFPEKVIYKMFPTCASQWKNLKEKFFEHEFIVVMQKPGMFLWDEKEIFYKTSISVSYVFLETLSAKEFAKVIIEQKPDVAIAMTYWVQPFDWMCIKDSLVAEFLSKTGIKTVCHSVKCADICFDKWKTHLFLEQNGFNCAKSVYVQHQMFFAERNRNCLSENVYKEYVFNEISKLNFPVVIKDVFGLSSFGMDVVTSFSQAKEVLLSKKNKGDRIIEEFLEGNSYGCEIYGSPDNYIVSPLFINSVNRFGLTSPKQNVKLGPVKDFSTLKQDILRVANLLQFNGIAQFDLVYSKGKWYIIEINSRISGMTQTIASSMGLSLYELVLASAGIYDKNFEKLQTEYKYVMNLKFPILDDDVLKKMCQIPFVLAVNQIENHEAKQLREIGYTEVIFGQTDTLEELMDELDTLNKDFFQVMEQVFYENAKKLAKIIER